MLLLQRVKDERTSGDLGMGELTDRSELTEKLRRVSILVKYFLSEEVIPLDLVAD